MMVRITGVNLSAIDLNLFLVLHAVLESGSATGAARELHVTQSAVSNALARLRDVLGDPLVVRSGRGLVPTPRCEELRPFIASAVGQLQLALEGGQGFKPETCTRTFTVAGADHHGVSDVPKLAALFAKRLPAALLRVVSIDYLVERDGLTTGLVDVALGPPEATGPGCHAEPLYTDDAVLLVRRDHPRIRGKTLTKALYNTSKHIDLHLAEGRPGIGHQQHARILKEHGLTREVGLAVPHFFAAAMAAARSDLIAGVPRRVAKAFCDMLPLRTVEMPFPSPRMTKSLIWHTRTDADPGARYFRSLVVEALRE
ncbi:LysR family transcriptional regulator [Corallococcus exiguus]|uniref:LysR family transcriptional regulator n=1 Tax=Corallococcus exiguus TaxID=83462 RepID=A0A7X4YHH9_9BACT|nr:LysR family transcriptional regulator [Corallococcus exiguus]NBC44497.1 LysR family transcriptional regulator [Corallococcus exiguus]TNV56561.1 LysR family transcriptional regulator [Corallococcus exiguus]